MNTTQWVAELSQTVRQLLFTLKRYYEPEWGDNWREHFTVDRINGYLGHELKFRNQKLVSNYLRVGYDQDGAWRIYKLRPDFSPAEKVQMEDDITASIVLPREALNDLDPQYDQSEREAGGELRAAAVSASRRCHPPGRGRAGGERHRGAGEFPVELRGADGGTGARAGGARGGVRSVYGADEALAGGVRGAAGRPSTW